MDNKHKDPKKNKPNNEGDKGKHIGTVNFGDIKLFSTRQKSAFVTGHMKAHLIFR